MYSGAYLKSIYLLVATKGKDQKNSSILCDKEGRRDGQVQKNSK